MKVRLKSDLRQGQMIGPKGRRSADGYIRNLSPKHVYTVYGLVIENGYPLYFIVDDIGSDYPIPHPYELYEIIDSRWSQYWVEKVDSQGRTLLFKEWSENDSYFEDLIEGGELESSLFRKYKRWMDDEFRNACLRRSLEENDARVFSFEEGDIFIKKLKDIYGEKLHNKPLNDLEEEVWKSTVDGHLKIANYPATDPVILFFEPDIDSRLYLLKSCSDLVRIMDKCPKISFSITDLKMEFLLTLDDSVIVGSGLALAWDFWDL